jgi:ferric-dicitrate binding protein FerR (iron transport regulator)
MSGAALAVGMAHLRAALAADAIARGVARVQGDVRVNGRPAQQGMRIKAGDSVRTGPDAELVAVVGRDAFLVRADSHVELSGSSTSGGVGILRVVSGALLAVFAPGQPKQVRTASASIGIRGTAVYVELETGRTYVCTCYGTARLTPVDEPKAAETVRTRHHDQPRYIYAKGMPRRIEQAPVVNHTDAELTMLESLVGRKVPFSTSRY